MRLDVVVFNPTYGVFTKVQVYFIFARGGRVWKRIDFKSVHTKAVVTGATWSGATVAGVL